MATPTDSPHLQAYRATPPPLSAFQSLCRQHIHALNWGTSLPDDQLLPYLERLDRVNRKHEIFFLADFMNGLKIYTQCIMVLLNPWNSEVHNYFYSFCKAESLLVTCLMIGSKFQRDKPFSNDTWSRLSGIQIELLNKIELEILKLTKFGISRLTEKDWENNFIKCMHAAPVIANPKIEASAEKSKSKID